MVSSASVPRHILLFMPSFRGGGAERVMVTLANALVARQFRVTMVVASSEGPHKESLHASVTLVDLAVSRIVFTLWPLKRLLVSLAPDAVMSTLTHANAICSIAHRLANCQATLTVREASMPRLTDDFYHAVIRFVARRCYGRANTLVCVSPAVKDAVLREFKPKSSLRVRVINNPSIPKNINQLIDRAPTETYGDFLDSAYLLAVGRLHPTKKFDVLLRALKVVRGSVPMKLLILGEGDARRELENLAIELGIADAVLMPGFVSNPYYFMSRCDVFVLSSSSEGSPNNLIQALSCGARIVATDLPGSTDVVLKHGELGKLVPVGDEIAFAKAIVESVKGPVLVYPEESVAEYTEDAVVSQYMDTLFLTSGA